jgi:hypothetical protein
LPLSDDRELAEDTDDASNKDELELLDEELELLDDELDDELESTRRLNGGTPTADVELEEGTEPGSNEDELELDELDDELELDDDELESGIRLSFQRAMARTKPGTSTFASGPPAAPVTA